MRDRPQDDGGWIDEKAGAIRPGNRLTVAPPPLHADGVVDPVAPGFVVGKSLEPLETESGMIRILVMIRLRDVNYSCAAGRSNCRSASADGPNFGGA